MYLALVTDPYSNFIFQIPDYRNAVIVARNPNSVKRASSYAERLRLGIAVIHGEERIPESEEDDGRNSPPIHEMGVRSGLEILPSEFFISFFSYHIL